MSDKLTEVVDQAAEILNEIRFLRATQCLNCGKVYHNSWGTHRPRGIFKAKCDYRPVGWQATFPDSPPRA